MKTVNFDPNGEPLRISFKFKGVTVDSYTYTLYKTNSNEFEDRHSGNNQNTEDDSYLLPVPVSVNANRIIEYSVSFKGLDPINFKEYENSVEIFQGTNLVGSDKDTGIVTGKPQDTLMFFQLKSL
jgi:hypothetical protein